MTAKALEILDPGTSGRGRAPGFFLQVEGASIDKRDHAAEPCQQIGEMLAFDRTVQLALDFAATHGDTPWSS